MVLNNIALDEEFVLQLSSQLERFRVKRRNPFIANFRCPFCGDSKKDKKKARGYLYENDGTIWYSCKNCNVPGINVPRLLKHVDQRLYSEYVKEKYKGNKPKRRYVAEEVPQVVTTGTIDLPRLDSLPKDHSARKFLAARRFPEEHLSKLFYADKFFEFSNTFEPGKFKKDVLKHDEPRIVIPFYDVDKRLITFQGRAIGDAKTKYITVKTDPSQPHVFGADRADFTRRRYIVEGPFDSLFLSNAMAVAQSDLMSACVDYGMDTTDDVVLVFDNEPRNKEIMKQIRKAASAGWKIVVWPPGSDEHGKDVNAMIQNGFTAEDVERILYRRTFEGARAELELNRWSK